MCSFTLSQLAGCIRNHHSIALYQYDTLKRHLAVPNLLHNFVIEMNEVTIVIDMKLGEEEI
jgi:hypothetical protein